MRRGVANCGRVIPGLERTTVTVSIGIASIRAGYDFEDALLRADHSLYAAKESGRDRVVREDERVAPA